MSSPNLKSPPSAAFTDRFQECGHLECGRPTLTIESVREGSRPSVIRLRLQRCRFFGGTADFLLGPADVDRFVRELRSKQQAAMLK